MPLWDEIKKRAGEEAEKVGKKIQDKAKEIADDPEAAIKGVSNKLKTAGENVRKRFEEAGIFGQDAIKTVQDLRKDIEGRFQRAEHEITKLPETIDGLKQQLAAKIEGSSGTIGNAVEKGADTVERLSGYLSVRGAIVSIATKAVKHNAKGVIGNAAGNLAKILRGDKMAFLDTIVKEPSPREKLTGVKPDVRAMIYMPGGEGANEKGIGVFPELTLLELEQKAHNVPQEADVFRKARAAVRDKKAELGVHVQTTLNNDGPDETVPRL